MGWIKAIDEDHAEGMLARVYAATRKRAGKVFNILKVQSQNPRVLHTGMSFYMSIMHEDSPLTRGQREMLALVVSNANNCHY